MPEIAEVRTVATALNKKVLHKNIIGIDIIYDKTVAMDKNEFKKLIINKTIEHIDTVGKWLLFRLGEYTLVSHLRMEGKYFVKSSEDPVVKHEHVIFHLADGTDLRYHDTRKFGRMKVVKTSDVMNLPEIKKLGIEPDNKELTSEYIYNKIHHLRITIKQALLDQTIINGLGNIYANEVLFYAKIKPTKKCNKITKKECEIIREGCNEIITKATKSGGTTIRSYTSQLGVKGSYQEYLLVHDRKGKACVNCGTPIDKITVGGRGTYYCKNCQK